MTPRKDSPLDVPLWAWLSLVGLVPVLVAVDLLSCRAPAGQVPSLRRSVVWSVIWFALGLAFTGAIALELGSGAAGEYLSGYLLERSLSLDNIFVFALIFAAFAVPSSRRGRVLLFGIVGALALRFVFIAVGAALLGLAGWVIYLFGALLVASAIKMFATPAGRTPRTPRRTGWFAGWGGWCPRRTASPATGCSSARRRAAGAGGWPRRSSAYSWWWP